MTSPQWLLEVLRRDCDRASRGTRLQICVGIRTDAEGRTTLSCNSRAHRTRSIDRHFLYLVPNHDLLWFVADRFLECKRTVCFGLFKDFLEQTLTLPVRKSGSPASVSLDSILTHRKVAQRTGPLFPDIAV